MPPFNQPSITSLCWRGTDTSCGYLAISGKLLFWPSSSPREPVCGGSRHCESLKTSFLLSALVLLTTQSTRKAATADWVLLTPSLRWEAVSLHSVLSCLSTHSCSVSKCMFQMDLVYCAIKPLRLVLSLPVSGLCVE